MNATVNKLLLVGDKFMLKIHLKQPGLHIVLVDHSLKVNKNKNI